jgi:PAS domain S-box-containing protein
MLGYSLSELEPTYIETWNNLTHPDDQKRSEKELQDYLKGKTPIYDTKVRMQHKDGHWVWVWDRGAIFEEDEDGNPTRMVGTHIDITEWMEAEERLKRSEKKYRELFENSSDPSLLEKNGHIIDCNQAVLDLLGYDKKNELIGKTILDISPEHQSSGWNSEELFSEALKELSEFRKKALKFDWEHLKKDGSVVPVETVMTNLTGDDGDSLRYVVWRDITDRKEAESELLKAYEERGALLAEIHHRVKNNLAIISGLIQLQIFGSDDKAVAEQLGKSVNRIKSIALIHEQLYQSKNCANISLRENIEKQAHTLFNMYKSQNTTPVDLKLELEEVQININQALPVGLLLNEILNNAFKHAFIGRAEGEVFISLKETDEMVQLMVKDNGIGFSENAEQNQSSLGHTLIDTFIKQLRAKVELNTEKGTSYRIRFKKQDLKGTMASNMSLM